MQISKSNVISIIIGIILGRSFYWIMRNSMEISNGFEHRLYQGEGPDLNFQDGSEQEFYDAITDKSSVPDKKITSAFNICRPIIPFAFKTLEDLQKLENTTIGAWSKLKDIPPTPKIHVVTPTYRNPKQDAELVRTYQALWPARHAIEWHIVDEYEKGSKQHIQRLRKLLETFNQNISITLFRSFKRSANFMQKVQFSGNPRGVDARRTVLKELREMEAEGILYFADDDNTYDSDLFRQIQTTKSITAWPVGCMTLVGISSPIVNRENDVIGFHDGWIGGRVFPVDFAEFAVNLEYVHMNPFADIPYLVSFEETKFLEELHLSFEQVEALGDGAKMVLAYHTKTKVPITFNANFSFAHNDLKNTNLPILWTNLYSRG